MVLNVNFKNRFNPGIMSSFMKDVWYWSTVGLELMAGNPKVTWEFRTSEFHIKHRPMILGLLFRRITQEAVCVVQHLRYYSKGLSMVW